MRLLKAVGMISLSVTLTPVQAAALAEWCRRADLKDFRKIARNDGEAYDMADALSTYARRSKARVSGSDEWWGTRRPATPP